MSIVPGSPVDAPALEGPLKKTQREDLQTYSFLLAVAIAGAQHPVGARPGAIRRIGSFLSVIRSGLSNSPSLRHKMCAKS
jgi:hypothetical protein